MFYNVALKLHTELEWLLINIFGKHVNSYAFVNLQIFSPNSTITFILLLSLWLLLSLFNYHCYHYFHYYCCHTIIIWSLSWIGSLGSVAPYCWQKEFWKLTKSYEWRCALKTVIKSRKQIHVVLILCWKSQYINLWCSITLHWNYIQNLNDCW